MLLQIERDRRRQSRVIPEGEMQRLPARAGAHRSALRESVQESVLDEGIVLAHERVPLVSRDPA